MFFHSLACLLFSANPFAQVPQDVSLLPEAEPALASPSPLLREEFFDLTLANASGGAPSVGALAWRHRGGAIEQLEWELWLPLDDARVLHVEPLSPTGPQMIWRELRPGGGRSLTVNRSDDGSALSTIEWGREETLRCNIPAPEGAVLPLNLLELVRRGDASSGRFLVFDPLSLALDPLQSSTRILAVEPGRAAGPTLQAALQGLELRRAVTLTREDGSLAGEYVFCGEELVSFRWQVGGLSGRRIAESEYTERIAELRRASRHD